MYLLLVSITHSVLWQSSCKNPIGGGDYTPGPYSLMFAAGATAVQFDIAINDDRVFELNERFNLIISPTLLPRDVTLGNIDQATVTIIDNDGE